MTATPSERSFLVLHGWQNHRPAGHWQHWLAGQLTDLGHPVGYPPLPDPDEPDLDRWLTTLDGQLDALRGPDSTVICHSLACLLWLHAAARPDPPVAVTRVLLVAPPSAGFVRQNPPVAAFAALAVTAGPVAAAAGDTRIVAADDDPCCPEGAVGEYGHPLGLRTDVVAGGGHLNIDAGYGPWPALLDLVPRSDAGPSDHRAVGRRPGRPAGAGTMDR